MPSDHKTKIQARKHNPDYSIILTMSILMIIGMVVLFSIGPALQVSTGVTVGKQMLSIMLGICAFCFTFFVPIDFWPKVQKILIWMALIASAILILLPGDSSFAPDIKGAQRWLVFGPISFQPAELIKFSILLYLAAFLTTRVHHGQLNNKQQTLYPVAVITAVLGLIVAVMQRDLGTMIAVVSIVVGMLYVSGLRLQHMMIFLTGLFSAGVLAVLLAPHRVERLLTFVNPSSDVQDTGYHINQALIAVGSGGLFGLGLGKSVQAYGYLPEAANDSIFAIYSEKFGFIGAVIVVSLFGFFLIKLARIVQHAPNTYTRLLSAGIFAWIGSHIAINIGAILGLMPLTGITLPFLSYGGSSLIFIMAAVGLALNISRYTVSDRAIKSEGRSGHAHSSHRRRNVRSRISA